MKTKIVLWGTNSEEAKILIALELKPEENKVAATVFPESVATEEFHEALIKEWREGKEVPFPDVYTQSERELTASDGILPEGVKVNKPDIVSRAQTEWHFIVLSSKLYQAYQSELEDLNERISTLTAYDNKAWDELKQFWNKVREQMRDRNLFREHADQLKNKTNTLFDTLKKLRSSLDAEFEAAAKVNYDKFSNRLSEIEEQLKGKANLFSIFEDLKSIQGEFKKAKLTRDLRSEVWARIDKIFKEVKERRFGSGGQMEKLQRRQHGLTNAIKKMENSIRRDEDELSFQERKVNSAYTGQLESQLRQAKINMIQERIRSKNEKLSEMRSTFKDLEQKMTNLQAQIEKEAKDKAAKLEAAKAKAAALAAKEAERVAKIAAERKAEEEAKAKAAQEAAVVETPAEEEATEEVKTETPVAESQDNNTSETPAKEEDVQE